MRILFKKRKGFVLISTMLIVLMLSVIASEMSKAYFLDIRKEGYLSFDAIAHTKRIESEKFLLNFIKRELNKNANVNKQNPLLNETLIFQFDDFILQGSLIDYSNCFNVNHLITFKAGKSKDNLKAIKYFEDLLSSYEINYLDAEQIIDQILDWMDDDDVPRNNGAENYFYANQLHYPREFTSKRLFINKSELLAIPSINKIKNHDIWKKLCIIPMSSNFYLNINSLQDDDKHLLSSAIGQSNLNEAALMIKKTPIEGFSSIKEFLERFNLQETELPIALDISSNIFLFSGTINYQEFSYNFKTLIKKENNFNYRIIDRL